MRYRFKRTGDRCRLQYRFGFFFWINSGAARYSVEDATRIAGRYAFAEGHVVELVP